MEPDEFQIRGGKCGEAARPLTFITQGSIFGFPVTCHYTKASLSGFYTTHPDEAILTISGQVFTRVNSLSAGSCQEKAGLDVSFTLEAEATRSQMLYIH